MTHNDTAKPAGYVWKDEDAVITPIEAHRRRKAPDGHELHTIRCRRPRPMCF